MTGEGWVGLLTLASIALFGVGIAKAETLALNPDATEIRFSLGATLHSVEGSLRLERGEIHFEPSGGPASGEVVVDATSAGTGHDGRDEEMHEKVLETDRFGLFVFRPTETIGTLARSGTSRIELHGQLEIHGDSHPVSLPAELTVADDQVSGTATLEIPYVAWGMKDPSRFVLRVKKTVSVEIVLLGRLSPTGPSPD